MIQDASSAPEIYLPLRGSRCLAWSEGTIEDGDGSPHSTSLVEEGHLRERQVLYCVQVPFETEWAASDVSRTRLLLAVTH